MKNTQSDNNYTNNGVVYTWDKRLVCAWSKVTVPFAKTVEITVDEDCCTDMIGAVKFSKAVLPDVERINVIAGSKLDISYVNKGRGWLCDRHYTKNPKVEISNN